MTSTLFQNSYYVPCHHDILLTFLAGLTFIHLPSHLITLASGLPLLTSPQKSWSTFLMGLPASCHSPRQPLSELEVAKLIFNCRSGGILPETSPDSLLPTRLNTGLLLGFKRPPGYPAYLLFFFWLALDIHTLYAAAWLAKLSHLCDQILLSISSSALPLMLLCSSRTSSIVISF